MWPKKTSYDGILERFLIYNANCYGVYTRILNSVQEYISKQLGDS